MRLLIILAAFGFLIAALHVETPLPVKILAIALPLFVIICNAKEL